MGERNFFSGGTVDFEGLKVLALLCGCLLSQAGLYLLPLSPNWQMLYPARKDAVGFGELNLSRGPGCPLPPALSRTYFPMQARNPASRPGDGCRLAWLCVLQPAGLPPGRLVGATRASCASTPMPCAH